MVWLGRVRGRRGSVGDAYGGSGGQGAGLG